MNGYYGQLEKKHSSTSWFLSVTTCDTVKVQPLASVWVLFMFLYVSPDASPPLI